MSTQKSMKWKRSSPPRLGDLTMKPSSPVSHKRSRKRSRSHSRSRSRSRSRSSSGPRVVVDEHSQYLDNTPRQPFKYYHEGGDCFRAFIVLEIAASTIWYNTNICFYLSSGRSNASMNGIFANTFIPCGGILTSDAKPNILHVNNNWIEGTDKYERGWIIKLSSFKLQESCLKWKVEFIKEYLSMFLDNKDFSLLYDIFNTWISGTIRKPLLITAITMFSKRLRAEYTTTESLQTFSNNYAFISNLILFLESYFTTDWQLFISAKIGGGYWENPSQIQLRTFILEKYSIYNDIPINLNSIEEIRRNLPTHNDDTPENTDEIIDFLTEHNVQDIINDGRTNHLFQESVKEMDKVYGGSLTVFNAAIMPSIIQIIRQVETVAKVMKQSR